MSWIDFYLVCFLVGLALASLSLFLGLFHLDLPGTKWDFLTGGHVHFGSHLHADALVPGHGPGGGATSGHPSAANFSTAMAFLVWFGGAGALLTSSLHLGQWMVLPAATASGVFGAWLVHLFVARVLMGRDHSMRRHEYALPGTLAMLTLAIREGGTGAIGYVQGGTRKSAAARAEAQEAIPLGAEVIVTRYEDGIAYVRRFDGERLRTM
jgi:membrane protein implicated in regulation of membrane protease activity